MADIDIVVDSGDLKTAITLLEEYGLSFVGMVNKVQTEGNRLARATKATTDQLTQAWANAEKQITNRQNAETAKQEEQTLKRREQNWRQFFQQDYMRSSGTGINRSNSALVAELEKAAAEEKRILDARQQQYKQFFQQDFLKGPSASSAGAPRSAADSALLQNEKALADAADETARAIREKEREVAALTLKYNPLLAAEQQYLRMQQEISRSLEMGVIDAKQQAAALQQLEKEYQALGQGVYLAGSRFNQFGEMAGISGRSASRFGMYAQQAGYQVGDFAVQLQSGTNAGVAFSQQAAQLAGLIPGLAGAVTTFAAIGLGLFIQMMTRSKEEATELDNILSDFKKFDDVFASMGTSLADGFGSAISQVRARYGDLVADLTSSTTKDALSRLTNALNQDFRRGALYDPEGDSSWIQRQLNTLKFGAASMSLPGGFSVPGGENYIDNLSEKRQEYLAAIEGLDVKIKELGESGFFTSQQLAEGFADWYTEIKNSGNLTDELLKRLQSLAEEAGIGEQVAQIINSRIEAENRLFEEIDRRKLALEQENKLLEINQTYKENSVAWLDAQKALQLEIYEAELASAGINGVAAGNLLRLKEIQIDYEQSVARSQAAVETLGNVLEYISGIDISSVFVNAESAANRLLGVVNAVGRGLAQVGRLGMEAQALQAQKAALDAGKSPGEARVEADVVRYGQSLQDIPDNPVGRFFKGALTTAFRNQQLQNLQYTEEISDGTKAYNDANKPSGGGRKGGGKSKLSDAEKDAKKAQEALEKFYEQFNLNIEQQKRLMGIYGEQREELEKVIEIENRLGEARTLVSQAQIEAMAQEELALERKLEREQELFNIGSSNVENLLMSIVNGTSSIEDAFKAMLANIISEVYQSFVAKGAADVAGNFLVSMFSAKGNAFGSGGVKMFAKGGVVGSPTLFGYNGGKTGMMGEAGPEAIMPLKRNSQGELGVKVSGGSSGSVVVNNHWHIAANGDESVRRIIQAETPKISEAAKRAVIDANRRSQKGFR